MDWTRRQKFNPDGRQIAAFTYARLRQWDALGGRLVQEYRLPDDPGFTSASFSPDSRVLLSSGLDFAVRLWDVRTGQLVGLMRHPDWVNHAEFSPDGRRVLAAMETPVVWVWDARHKNVAAAAQSEALEADVARLAAQGDIEGAETKLREAVSRNPDRTAKFPGAESLNSLCWFGALYGQPSKVLSYCEQAVSLDPYEANYRDSRGLARASVGDISGAVEDFTSVVENWRLSPPEKAEWLPKREQWLLLLQEGINPFDAITLEELRNE